MPPSLVNLPAELETNIWDGVLEECCQEELAPRLRGRVYQTPWKDRAHSAQLDLGKVRSSSGQDEHVREHILGEVHYCGVVLIYTPRAPYDGPIWNVYGDARDAVMRMVDRLDKLYLSLRTRLRSIASPKLRDKQCIWVHDNEVAECSKTSHVRPCQDDFEYRPYETEHDNLMGLYNMIFMSFLAHESIGNDVKLDITPIFFRRKPGGHEWSNAAHSLSCLEFGFNQVAWAVQQPPTSMDVLWSPTLPSTPVWSDAWAMKLYHGPRWHKLSIA